jgi:NADPH-dependent ferric siderophore reductase
MTQSAVDPGFTTARKVSVQEIIELTQRMRRIVFCGDDLDGFAYNQTQLGPYLKLRIPLPDLTRYPSPPEKPTADETGGEDKNTVLRTYSVRHFDPETLRLTIDFVLHGDEGIASGWAAKAVIGDTIEVLERGSRPARDIDWFLILGDQTALPAIAQMLENMPADSEGQAFIEVADAGEWQPITNRTKITVTWLFTDGSASGLPEKCATSMPARGRIYVWAGAEADIARTIRAKVKTGWKLPPEQYFIVNYWRHGFAEGIVGK